MAKFAYNNAKNTSTIYTPFEFNCGFYSRVSCKNVVDPPSKSKTVDQLILELQTLMSVYKKNLQYIQKL